MHCEHVHARPYCLWGLGDTTLASYIYGASKDRGLLTCPSLSGSGIQPHTTYEYDALEALKWIVVDVCAHKRRRPTC